MNRGILARSAASALAVLFAHGSAFAVNGAQPGGNGIKSASMGGASIALPQDAIAAANNPAGIALVPDSVVVDAQAFHLQSSANYVIPSNELSNSQKVATPEVGGVWHPTSEWTVGISQAGAGAGSNYGQAALPVPGAGNAKITLKVTEAVPAVAWKPRADISLGLGLNLAYEQFEADGVIVPAPVAGGLLALPSHGKPSATGLGLRLGGYWAATPDLALGVNLKSRTRMSKLGSYDQDLLAYSDGRIDIPAQYGVGAAWHATEHLTFAVDWLRIMWGDLKLMKDPNGFRWRNQPVLRMGAAWSVDEHWALRAGFSCNRKQIDSSRATQNLLVPSINDRAYTVGAGWRVNKNSEINAGYEINPRKTLYGTGASAGTTLTSEIQVFMLGYQYTF